MTELYDAAAAAWDEEILRAKSGVAETPERDLERTIAHLYSTAAESNFPHLQVHTAAAAKSVKDPVLLRHHLRHAIGHQKGTSEHLSKLREAVSRRLPAVAKQLADLDEADPGHRSVAEHVPRGALDMSIAHDIDNAQRAAAHVGRHLAEAQAGGGQDSVTHNIAHADKHIGELGYHLGEAREDLIRRLPAVGAELAKLQAVADPGPADRSYAGDLAWNREMRARW